MSKKPYIFVSTPLSEDRSTLPVGAFHVLNLIEAAAVRLNIGLYRVDKIEAGTNIVSDIQKAIQECSIVIADITNANPNVMYELGIAQTQEKPIIYVARNSLGIPFGLSGFPVLICDYQSSDAFLLKLYKAIERAIKNPEEFLTSRAIAEKEKRESVFVSYSHNDREFLNRLLTHLKPLEKNGFIDLWVDTRLRAGDRWEKEIEKALNKATVAILVVSADFLASDFIVNNELPPILRNAEEKGTKIIPLIVKPCRFTRDNNLKHFQSVNDPKDALILLSEGEREKYYDLVSSEIEEVFNKVNA